MEIPEGQSMIRKLKSGKYRLYSRKTNRRPGNAVTSGLRQSQAAEKHERAVQYFKRRAGEP